MKADKIVKKQIVFESILTIIILAVIVIGGYILFNNMKGKDVFSSDDLLVEFKADGTSNVLLSMDDEAGMKTVPYTFTVTNNGKRKVSYSVFIKPNFEVNIDYSPYVKISVDDLYIDTFNNLKKGRDNNFVIFQEKLDVGYTANHVFKIWLSNDAPNELKGIKANFDFNVEGE